MSASNDTIRQWKCRMHTVKRKAEAVFSDAMQAGMDDDVTDQLDACVATIENTIEMLDRTLSTNGGSNAGRD